VIAFADGLIDPDHWSTLENCLCLASVPSSNALARELVEVYFNEDQDLPPTVVVAESQPQARGRGGKHWEARRGMGLYLTVVRKAESERLSIVPIAMARWIRDVLKEKTGVPVDLKWPNDLYAGRRKLAGVLSESRTQGDGTYVAVGIGVNVRGRAAEVGVEGATTLEEESGRSAALAPLLQAILDRVDRELTAPHWGDEVAAWERASLHKPGDSIEIRQNGRTVAGEYLGLDPSGFLRLRTESGEEIVSSGELARW
jgi:BirA family biotin operon repressor/biotin-[acetyl-CoA-carboxylase] ligase